MYNIYIIIEIQNETLHQILDEYSLGSSVFQRTNPVIITTPTITEILLVSPFNCLTGAILLTVART
jgi:hypothetical protein